MLMYEDSIETKGMVPSSVRTPDRSPKKPHAPIKQSIMDKYETLLSKKPKKTNKGHRYTQRLAYWTRDKNELQKELLDKAFVGLAVHRYTEPPDGERSDVEGTTGSSIALWEQGRDSISILQKKNHDRWRGMERRKILEARALKNKLHPRNKIIQFLGPKTRKYKGIAAGTRKRRRRRRRGKRKTRRGKK